MASKRVLELKKRIKNTSDPEDIFTEIMDIFKVNEIIPDAGKYYTFLYQPKTPGVVYDQHPLVAVIKIYPWGFNAINFHWGERRNYSWFEINSVLYEVKPEEIGDMRNINYAKVLTMPS